MVHFKVKSVPSGCCPKYEIYARGFFKYRLVDTVKSKKAIYERIEDIATNYVVHYE